MGHVETDYQDFEVTMLPYGTARVVETNKADGERVVFFVVGPVVEEIILLRAEGLTTE